jgi:hypothetical protein
MDLFTPSTVTVDSGISQSISLTMGLAYWWWKFFSFQGVLEANYRNVTWNHNVNTFGFDRVGKGLFHPMGFWVQLFKPTGTTK